MNAPHSILTLALVGALASAASSSCARANGVATNAPPAPAYAATLHVVNSSSRQKAFEFRIDGVQVLDTTVAPGGLPALVLSRRIRLAVGKHHLLLFDRQLQQGYELDFEAKPSMMSIVLTLDRERSSIQTFYTEIGFI
jgi:hypothetical protein